MKVDGNDEMLDDEDKSWTARTSSRRRSGAGGIDKITPAASMGYGGRRRGRWWWGLTAVAATGPGKENKV